MRYARLWSRDGSVTAANDVNFFGTDFVRSLIWLRQTAPQASRAPAYLRPRGSSSPLFVYAGGA